MYQQHVELETSIQRIDADTNTIKLPVTVEAYIVASSEYLYGADADGRRGRPQRDVEVDIASVIGEDGSSFVEVSNEEREALSEEIVQKYFDGYFDREA